MSNYKLEFSDWIKNAKKTDGKPYSKAAMSNYINALEKYCYSLGLTSLKHSNLFECVDLEEYLEAKSIIQNHPDYHTFNSSRNRVFSSALKIYERFLNEYLYEQLNRERFRKWMETNSDREYRHSTVSRYVVALDKCEERLSIELPVSIWKISSQEEFIVIEQAIKNSEKYTDVNKHYGNGDLSAALSSYSKFISEIYKKCGEPEMTTKQKLDEIKKYIAAKGFSYGGALIENFYLSLKSKPFVILAGISGTGKTRLVKLFAEAIGAEFKLVPVRPDWSDSSDLFGHLDLAGNFVSGEVIGFISEAVKNPAKPYFLCLDEMNLARVEYYFSDFLSIIETRERENGKVVTDKFSICDEAKKIYGDISIPDNLYIVGTVNMDETTFPFSKKVLDRANTIEFSYVDLTPNFDDTVDDYTPIDLQNSFMATEFIKLAECSDEADYIGIICSVLSDINKILVKADAHIGYRVRDEICFYMINNKKANLLREDDAMDNQIMQKILPRIQGSSSAVKKMLCELFKLCAADFKGYQTESNVADEMKKVIENGSYKYKNSAMKIAGMVSRFEEDGFTSYWI